MQAIIKIGPAQYSVIPGQKLLVANTQIDGVLMIIDDGKTTVGTPFITDAVVKIKTMGEVKGKKIRAATYKAKSRERKVRGFRAQYTEIMIEDIYVGSKKEEPAKETKKEAVKNPVKKAVKAKS